MFDFFRRKSKTVGHGDFHCPKCGDIRPYDRKNVRKFIVARFVFSYSTAESVGEFIQCNACASTYDLDVLEFQPDTISSTLKPVVNIVKRRFDEGIPVEYVASKLYKEGLTNNQISTIIQAAIGKERLICKKCTLLYPTVKTTCHECGSSLEVYQP